MLAVDVVAEAAAATFPTIPAMGSVVVVVDCRLMAGDMP